MSMIAGMASCMITLDCLDWDGNGCVHLPYH